MIIHNTNNKNNNNNSNDRNYNEQPLSTLDTLSSDREENKACNNLNELSTSAPAEQWPAKQLSASEPNF